MSTFVLVIILNIVDTPYVSPEISSLGELHGTETAGVGFLASVLQTVTFHTLFLSESSATVLAFIRPNTSVNTLMSSNLRRLQEFLTAAGWPDSNRSLPGAVPTSQVDTAPFELVGVYQALCFEK